MRGLLTAAGADVIPVPVPARRTGTSWPLRSAGPWPVSPGVSGVVSLLALAEGPVPGYPVVPAGWPGRWRWSRR